MYTLCLAYVRTKLHQYVYKLSITIHNRLNVIFVYTYMHSMGVRTYVHIMCDDCIYLWCMHMCGVEIICMYINHMNCILYTYISVILSTVVEMYCSYIYCTYISVYMTIMYSMTRSI